jgi:hypothetical protein
MPYYHVHTCNEAENIYTAKQLELIIEQGESTETPHVITNQDTTFYHNHLYRDP